ncbi:MAG: hypothetical protein PHU46_15250 [Rhodocyclaceae bacterium]|nr:hypothetical protein [Rhodocyclaceae bacterium]
MPRDQATAAATANPWDIRLECSFQGATIRSSPAKVRIPARIWEGRMRSPRMSVDNIRVQMGMV